MTFKNQEIHIDFCGLTVDNQEIRIEIVQFQS